MAKNTLEAQQSLESEKEESLPEEKPLLEETSNQGINGISRKLKEIAGSIDLVNLRLEKIEDQLANQEESLITLRDQDNCSSSPASYPARLILGLESAIQEPSGEGISANNYYPSRNNIIEIDN